MRIWKIKRLIKRVFKPPIKEYYLGKVTYGCPYFYPRNYVGSIINIRRLSRRNKQELKEYLERRSYAKFTDEETIYNNFPRVRRSYSKIINLFGKEYYVEWGWPIKFKITGLGWKDKYETPRHEWDPSFIIYFFKWQFCIFWRAPSINKFRDDLYWEMILWYLYYSNKDIKRAEETWGWVDGVTKESTWNKNYLI